eukprot:UN30364
MKNDNRKMKAAMVTAMDDQIGRMVETLKDNGKLDNTVIIFSTDNGGPKGSSSNYPLRGTKGSLYEGGVRGLGFIYSATLQPSVRTELMHVTDWYPTLTHLAGGYQGNLEGTVVDGYDQTDMIWNNRPSSRTEIVHNLDPIHCETRENVCGAIRKGDFKLIVGRHQREV